MTQPIEKKHISHAVMYNIYTYLHEIHIPSNSILKACRYTVKPPFFPPILPRVLFFLISNHTSSYFSFSLLSFSIIYPSINLKSSLSRERKRRRKGLIQDGQDIVLYHYLIPPCAAPMPIHATYTNPSLICTQCRLHV